MEVERDAFKTPISRLWPLKLVSRSHLSRCKPLTCSWDPRAPLLPGCPGHQKVEKQLANGGPGPMFTPHTLPNDAGGDSKREQGQDWANLVELAPEPITSSH